MAEVTEGRLDQQPGMSALARAVFAADRVIADPGNGRDHVLLAIVAALTDEQRALARLFVRAGVDPSLVWRVIAELQLGAALPREMVAPIGPGIDGA
jgi:hypothetical protein